jgi:hypothetical protein
LLDETRQKDFALRNAAWLMSDVISNRSADQGRREGFQAPIANDTPIAPEQIAVDDPVKMAVEIKRIAAFFGADLCAVTDLDERWLYKTRVDTRDMSEAENTLPRRCPMVRRRKAGGIGHSRGEEVDIRCGKMFRVLGENVIGLRHLHAGLSV